MRTFILDICTRIIFHSNGTERVIVKKILDFIDTNPYLYRIALRYLFHKSGKISLFFAPRYAKKHINDVHQASPLSEYMQITAITMVRNEHNRIHDCMRHLCALFDRVIVIDHRSDDDTGSIALSYQGINNTEVIVLRGDDEGHYQSEYMTACVRALQQEATTDWIFLLDVDEFLPFHNALEFRQTLELYREFPFIQMPWRNIALKQLDPKTVQGVSGILGPQSHLSKIALNTHLINNVEIIINEGNHTVRLPHTKTIIPTIRSFNLYHIPILGKKALQNKVKQGITSYQLSIGKRKSMGFHWKEMYNNIEKIMSEDDILQGIAIYYSTSLRSILNRVKDGTIMNGCKDFVINIAQAEKSIMTIKKNQNIKTFNLKNIDDVMSSIFHRTL